jgi:hypothetical protein
MMCFFFQLLFKYKLRKLDFRDYLCQNQECGIMVAVNREKISTFIESQWLYYLHIIKDKGQPYLIVLQFFGTFYNKR